MIFSIFSHFVMLRPPRMVADVHNPPNESGNIWQDEDSSIQCSISLKPITYN